MRNMTEFLRKGTKDSMMRWASMQGVYMSWFMCISTFIVVGIIAIKQCSVEWLGVAAVIGAIGAFITGILFAKAQQHKNEKEDTNGKM